MWGCLHFEIEIAMYLFCSLNVWKKTCKHNVKEHFGSLYILKTKVDKFNLFSLFIPLSTQNQAILMLARDQVADMESLHFLIFCQRKQRVIYQQGQKHIKSWEKIMVDICEKNDVLLQCILKSFRSLLLNYFSMVLLPNVFSNHGILFPD